MEGEINMIKSIPEGNDCYKYENLKRFIKETRSVKIKTIVDVGCDVKWKNVTLEIRRCFPKASITVYEPIKEHVDWARKALSRYKNITIVNKAVTAKHLFEDNLGEKRREQIMEIHVFKHQDESYHSCTFVNVNETQEHQNIDFKQTNEVVKCMTLDEVVREEWNEVDYLKTDCEGSEVSFLGCASPHAISRIRYIAGEYHNFEQFYPVALKLMNTHYVYLSGEVPIGSFFCERRTLEPKTMLSKIPSVKNYHIIYHRFNEEWIDD